MVSTHVLLCLFQFVMNAEGTEVCVVFISVFQQVKYIFMKNKYCVKMSFKTFDKSRIGSFCFVTILLSVISSCLEITGKISESYLMYI